MLARYMGIELRARRAKEGSSFRVDERKQSRKRRRGNDGENEIKAEHSATQLTRGVVEGELWPSTSSSDYEPVFDEEGDSDGQVSLVAKSGVGGKCGRQWATKRRSC